MQVPPISSGNVSLPAQSATVGPEPAVSEIRTTTAKPGTEAISRLLAQVVSAKTGGLMQLRLLSTDTMINVQLREPLPVGKLILVESRQQAGQTEFRVQNQQDQLTNQILRLLTPHQGNLKTQVAKLIQLPVATTQPNQRIPISAGQSGSHQQPEPLRQFDGLRNFVQPYQTLIKQGLMLPLKHRPTATQSVPRQNPGPAKTLHQQLLPTTQFLDPARLSNMASPNQPPALLKLFLPLLRQSLNQAPVNQEQAQARELALTQLTQLVARILLGGVRVTNSNMETEVSKNEWLTRFEQSLDSLQLEITAVREKTRDRAQDDDANSATNETKVRQWRVRLTFDFDELGVITAFVLLDEHRQMEVQLWSEQDRVREKILALKKQFSDRLQQATLNFGVVQLEVGVYEGTPPPTSQPITTQLVNETA